MERSHIPERKKPILPVFLFIILMIMVVLPAGAAAQPVITLLGRNPASITVGSVAYFDAGAMATDSVDGDLTASILATNNVNVTAVGSYTVNYSVTNSVGATTTAIRVVNVVNRLDPVTVPKYQTPLIIPPEMPKTSTSPAMDYYEIAVREFNQQILPAGYPTTTVWSYGSATTPGTFNYPAFTIEATANKMTKVKWMNQLVDQNGNYLPHLLPIDQTIHWANPAGGIAGRDMHGTSQNPYMGPVPAIVHVHGAHTHQESDGYPEAWFLPAAKNIPAGYATSGSYYDQFKANATFGAQWTPGSSVFAYPNQQRATTLWYHDHTLGMTRTNVYTGPAGFYLLRGGPDDLNLGFNRPSGTLNVGVNPADAITEIPLAIQDRAFNADGSLFYPDSRAFFDGFTGPYAPATDVSPIWNPEFFGDSIVVNGNTWPYQNVQQRQYRLRILNGDQARTLILQMDNGMSFTQIGSEGGFLPQPVTLNRLLIGPAERADVIVDFTNVPAGTNITMQNLGPDFPFQGGVPCPVGQDPLTNPGCGAFAPALAATTGQVMQFRVIPAVVADPSTPVASLVLPAMTNLGPASTTRQVSLNEANSLVVNYTGTLMPVDAIQARLGTVMTVNGTPMGIPQLWMDPITEVINQSETEIWEIYDFTVDAHPIHIHQVQFQVVNREIFDPLYGVPGTIMPPEAWETGYKDTVLVYPGQLTRVKARFDLAGLFVWHCHILEHEDNEMMRPYIVKAIPPAKPSNVTATVFYTAGVPQVRVNWTDNSYNEAGFRVQRATNAGFSAGVVTSVVGPNVESFITGALVNNTAYYFRVLAINSAGNSGWVKAVPFPVNTTGITPPPVITPPAKPTNVTAKAFMSGSTPKITVTWKDNSTNEAGFRVQRALDAGFSTGVVTAVVGANVTTFTTGALLNNTNYYIRVLAINSAGNSGWVKAVPFPVNTSTAAPVLTPAKPSNVVATAILPGGVPKVVVTWTDNANNEAGFRVQRALDAGFSTGVATAVVGPNVTTFTTGALNTGTNYYFRILAINSAGNSGWVKAVPFPVQTL